MGVTYGFYDSINNDRRYNAEQLSSIFDGIIDDGIFRSIGTSFEVIPSAGMVVSVGEGRAWFNHTWTINDAPLLLTVDQSEVALNRIDVVVLEINSTQEIRANSFKVVKGVPATYPVAPDLTKTDKMNQYPLCYISVGAGVTEIISSNITSKIGTTDCPYVTSVLEPVNMDSLLAHERDTNVHTTPEEKTSWQRPPVVNVTASITLDLTYAGAFLECTNATAIIITIPDNLSTPFPIGTEIAIFQYAAGLVSFAVVAGVTLRSKDGMVKIDGQYSSVAIKKIATDEWILSGALTT